MHLSFGCLSKLMNEALDTQYKNIVVQLSTITIKMNNYDEDKLCKFCPQISDI